MADPAFVRELKAWLRFDPRAALRSGDGLYSAASGKSPLPEWLGPRHSTSGALPAIRSPGDRA